MKNSKAFIILGLVVCFWILCKTAVSYFELTKTQVAKRFEKAGGVDKVNQEAKLIFERFNKTEDKLFFDWDLTNYPAISALHSPGTFVSLSPESPNFAREIQVIYGTSHHLKFASIFPLDFDLSKATNVSVSLRDPTCIRVAPNIIVQKEYL